MKYEQIIYLQGHQAEHVLEILKSKGEEAALEHLKQWHYPGEHEVDRKLSGTTDNHYYQGDYVVYYSSLVEYIGLECKVEDEDE